MDYQTLAQQAAEEHEKLDREVQVLKLRLGTPSDRSPGDWLSHCREHFRHFHTQLRRHMEVEEYGGFMKQVRDHRPTLESKVAKFELEHRAMRRSCNSIEDYLDDCSTPGAEHVAEVRRRIDALLEELERHEVAENRLAQEAFTRDIGAGD